MFIKKIIIRKKIIDLMLDYNNGLVTKEEFEEKIEYLYNELKGLD